MWLPILRGFASALGYISAGYAVSDFFNERQRTKQAEGQALTDPEAQAIQRKKWRTISLIAAVIGILATIGLWLYARKTAKK